MKLLWENIVEYDGEVRKEMGKGYCYIRVLLVIASKVHDFIKEFNAIESVRDWPVAHPQGARSKLSFCFWFSPLVDFLCELMQYDVILVAQTHARTQREQVLRLFVSLPRVGSQHACTWCQIISKLCRKAVPCQFHEESPGECFVLICSSLELSLSRRYCFV